MRVQMGADLDQLLDLDSSEVFSIFNKLIKGETNEDRRDKKRVLPWLMSLRERSSCPPSWRSDRKTGDRVLLWNLKMRFRLPDMEDHRIDQQFQQERGSESANHGSGNPFHDVRTRSQ